MKKLLILLLTAMLLCSFAACTVRGAEDESHKSSQTSAPNGSASGQSTAQPSDGTSGAAASGSDLYIPEPWSDAAQSALEQLRGNMAETGAVCAIAFVGYVDPNVSIAESVAVNDLFSETDCGERYPFLMEMTPAQCCAEGHAELYCLVPPADGCLVVIGETDMEEGEPAGPVRELYRSESGEPVYFTADSNGWGGSCIDLTVTAADGTTMHCTPALYCNLGTLAVPENVIDFSVYPGAFPSAEQ